MKVIKITALWCPGCLMLNKSWNKIKDKYNIETESLDIDFDEEEVKKYNIKNKLPVLIFLNNGKEHLRIIGEKTEKELIKIMEENNIL